MSSGGSVYSRGDKDKDKKEEKPDVGKAVSKGFADAGKAAAKFFSGLGGPEKKWQSKGGGQTLGSVESAGERPQQQRSPSRPQQAQGGPSAQSAPAGPPGPPADKAALASAAEARLAKLNQPKASAARSAALGRHRTFAPPEPSAGGGFDPTRAQFTSLSTARSSADVEDAVSAERRAAQTADEQWRALGAPAPGPQAPRGAAPREVAPDDALLAQLSDMGFDHADAAAALVASSNALELAIAMLSEDAGERARAAGAPAPASSAAQGEAPAEAHAAVSELEAAALLDGGAALAALSLVHRLLGNVAAHPDEAKYRRVRRTNAKVAAVLQAAPAAERLLVAAGFAADASGEFYDYEPGSEAALERALGAVGDALSRLERSAHAPLRPAAAEPRNLAVFRPPEGGGPSSAARFDLPPEFYELGHAEAKALLAASASRRQAESTLRTRAQREADAQPRRTAHVRALLRVRLPDGYVLQATFGAHEPLSEVYALVAASLRDQGLEFHLTRPAGTAQKGGSLRLDDFTTTITLADLAPASVLNCHVAEESASRSGPPFLRADLVDSATELE